MTVSATAKRFDCIAFKRRAQERIHDRTRGMTAEEEIAYFNRAALRGAMGPIWRKLRNAARRG